MPADLEQLQTRTTGELLDEASRLGIEPTMPPWKDELVALIASADGAQSDGQYGCGVLEVHGEGFGFLRSPRDNFLPGAGDIYVSQSQIRRFDLRTGDTVIGRIRPPKESERYPALLRVEQVNGDAADADSSAFDDHTTVHPSTRLPLSRDSFLSTIDWVAPLGVGQRGVLVAPTHSERTQVLRAIANLFAEDDGFDVNVLLLGDRPEDITEWRESTDAEVIATPFDELPSRHLQVADIAFARARRLAERGADVVLLVDSFSRLLRHASADPSTTPRTVDHVETGAMQRLRSWFASGRKLKDGGSVTLIAVVNDDPSSHADQVLRTELSELANWQVTLGARSAAHQADTPHVVPADSWTRREDLLVFGDELDRRLAWREALSGCAKDDAAKLASLAPADALDSSS